MTGETGRSLVLSLPDVCVCADKAQLTKFDEGALSGAQSPQIDVNASEALALVGVGAGRLISLSRDMCTTIFFFCFFFMSALLMPVLCQCPRRRNCKV